jgi:hypothetical protein
MLWGGVRLKMVRTRRVYGVLGLASLASALLAGCGGSGDTAAGGACHTATDCMPGLYCYPLTSPQGGTCIANADKAQPAQDGSLPDGGLAPMLPGITDAATTAADSATDAATTPDATSPTESGTPPDASAPTDTGVEDASSSG